MNRPKRSLLIAAAGVLAVLPAFPQSVISARSGMIHYAQGRVMLGNEVIKTKFGQFPQIRENQELRTEAGRAEVLLSPGVFLRVGEDTCVRMIDTRLTNARLEFLAGKILLEAAEMHKGDSVTLIYKDATVSLLKKGLYRFDTDPPQLRVFSGEALVEIAGQRVVVGKGKLLPFDGTLAVLKFDRERTDPFDRWSGRRAEHLALANVYAARSVRDSGMSWRSSRWQWNPYFGLFTFVPFSGTYYSPYGYNFWSPERVYVLYAAPRPAPSLAGGSGRSYDANRGYTVLSPTSSGTSGVLAHGASAPAGSSGSSPAPAPIPRDSGQAGGRTR